MKLSSLIEAFTQLDYDHFLEMDVQSIKNFRTDRPAYDREMEDMISFYYEMEYKWYYLNHNSFTGTPRRKENILAIFEAQFKGIIMTMAKAFSEVFSGWLAIHALSHPRQWAEERYRQQADQGENIDDIFAGAYGEWHGYAMNDKSIMTYRQAQYYMTPKGEKLLARKVNNLPVAKEFLALASQDYEVAEGEEPIAFSDYRDTGYDLFEFQKAIENYSLDMGEEFVIQFNEFIVFPLWYKFWKARGIDETRGHIKRLYEQLQTINTFPLMEASALINLVVQAVHQGGSMLIYFEEKYGVEPSFFDQFEENVPDEWEAELKEIGVDMSTN